MSASKLMSIQDAAATVRDGATIAIGGLSMNSVPMAFVRELAREGRRDLTVVAIVNGMAVDWLVHAGCVRRLITALVSFEAFGLAPAFRRAAESGRLEVEEYSEYLLIARLRAAATRVPFIPAKAGLGTDLIGLHPHTTRLEHDPVSGEAYVACTPLPVDVAVVHAHAGDASGNVRVEPKLVWMDNEIVNAAAATIVTVEDIVAQGDFAAAPHRTTYPRFTVDAVVEAPWGAYPTSCYPRYVHDGRFYADYVAAARTQSDFAEFWTRRVIGPDNHSDFLNANGGAQALIRVRRTMT